MPTNTTPINTTGQEDREIRESQEIKDKALEIQESFCRSVDNLIAIIVSLDAQIEEKKRELEAANDKIRDLEIDIAKLNSL